MSRLKFVYFSTPSNALAAKKKVAIDLIVQHIRDFLNNRTRYGSHASGLETVNNTTSLASFVSGAGESNAAYAAIRRFSTLCKELTIQSNVFFDKNQNLTKH